MSKKETKIRITEDVYRKLEILKYVWEDEKSYGEVINKLINEHDIVNQTIDGIKMKEPMYDKGAYIGYDETEEVSFEDLSDEEQLKHMFPYDLEYFKFISGVMGFQTLVNQRTKLQHELRKVSSEIHNYSDEKYYNGHPIDDSSLYTKADSLNHDLAEAKKEVMRIQAETDIAVAEEVKAGRTKAERGYTIADLL